MSDDVHYLSVEDIFRLHARVLNIDITSVHNQLRDGGALDSALARPLNHAHYENADLAMQAAILPHDIAQSQSFLDGNKRTALIAMATFLAINGWNVGITDPELARLILGFASGAPPDVLADELRSSMSPRF